MDEITLAVIQLITGIVVYILLAIGAVILLNKLLEDTKTSHHNSVELREKLKEIRRRHRR